MTAESYAAIEADGIAGRSGRSTPDTAELTEDLRRYRASMGPVNRDLVMAHHRANVHAQQLIELIRGLAPPPSRPRQALAEMSRLVRLEWRTRGDVHNLIRENAHLRDLLNESEEREREGQREVARQTALTRASYEGTLSWRVTAPLRAVAKLARRPRRRPAGGDGDGAPPAQAGSSE